MSEKAMTVKELLEALAKMPPDETVQALIWRNAPGTGRDILRINVQDVSRHPEGTVVLVAREQKS